MLDKCWGPGLNFFAAYERERNFFLSTWNYYYQTFVTRFAKVAEPFRSQALRMFIGVDIVVSDGIQLLKEESESNRV